MAVVTSSVKPRPADTWSLAKLCARYEGTTLKVLGVVSALGLWQLAVATGRVSPMVISSPSRIVVAGLDYVTSHQFAIDATTSGLEFIGGFGLAVIVGIVARLRDGMVEADRELPRSVSIRIQRRPPFRVQS